MATQKQIVANEAMADINTLLLVVMARSTETMPEALSLFDHLGPIAREQLKREWDTLRAPEFSKHFEDALQTLVVTVRQIKAGA